MCKGTAGYFSCHRLKINIYELFLLNCIYHDFQLVFEALPKPESDQARRYRGFIAIDDVKFNPGDDCKVMIMMMIMMIMIMIMMMMMMMMMIMMMMIIVVPEDKL